MQQQPTLIQRVVRAVVSSFDRSTKRFICLSAFTGCLHKDCPKDDAYFVCLNEQLDFAKDPLAAKFGAAIASRILDDESEEFATIIQSCRDRRSDQFLTRLAEIVPEYLRYGRLSDIKEDLRAFLDFDSQYGNTVH
jgi:hypothetical protein